MKVGLVHYTAPPVTGGVESVIARHAKLIADDGHDVTVVVGRGAPWGRRVRVAVVPQLDSRDARVLAVKLELDKGIVSSDFRALAGEIELALSKLLLGLDLVVMHNVCSLHKNLALTMALWRLSRRGDARWFAWHHDLAWLSDQYRGELHPGEPWDLLRTSWPHVRQVTISEYRAGQLAELTGVPESLVEVVPNGIDVTSLLKLARGSREAVRRHNLFDRRPLLLTPVRITRRKNLQLALRALASLRSAMPGATWIVTGPLGPHNPANVAYLEELKLLQQELGLEEGVVFLADERGDAVPDAEVPDWYQICDALLLTSADEGFGLPVLEAAIARMPVFCADIPALRELGRESATYFALSEEPASIAARIATRLRGDPVYELRTRHRTASSWDSVYRNRIKPVLFGSR